MSSLLESEKNGVTVISTVEKFGSEIYYRHIYYCVTRFTFLAGRKRTFTLDYRFSSYTSNCSYAYLSWLEDNTDDSIDISGTFSVVTHDGVIHVLAIFLNHVFEKNTVKEIKLRQLNCIPYEDEDLFFNGNLVLRCHLWHDSSQITNTEYRVRYRPLIQEWKSVYGLKNNDGNYLPKYTIGIPVNFYPRKNTSNFDVTFDFENLLNETNYPVLHVQTNTLHDLDINLRIFVFLQCIDGTIICLRKHKYYFHFIRRSMNFPIHTFLEELKNKENFEYPNSILNLICHVKCIKSMKVEFESFSDIDNSQLDVQAEGDELKPTEPVVTGKLLEETTLKQAIYSLYEEGKFCDVTLRNGMVSYPCHKVVLCSRSMVFSTMFETDMLEKKNSVVDIEDIDPRILSMFLKFLYTDEVGKLECEEALLLFAVADKYAVIPLQKKCISIFKTKITTVNAMDILISADLHQNEDLKKFSINYICKHAKSIIDSENWKNIKVNYPELILDVQEQLIKNLFQ